MVSYIGDGVNGTKKQVVSYLFNFLVLFTPLPI